MLVVSVLCLECSICNYMVLCSWQRTEQNMSELESAMIAIIHVFHKYSGHKCKLKKAELKDLVNNEMSHFIIVRHSLCVSQMEPYTLRKKCAILNLK
jgi:hypothetical protein